MSLSPAVSPSFCSLKISSGLLYGLKASRCVTLSLSGRSCVSPTLFLFEAKAHLFGLDMPTPILMLPRRGRDECRGLVRLASAGAGARTVTFLPTREQEISHQEQHCHIKISSQEVLRTLTRVCQWFPSSKGKLLCAAVFFLLFFAFLILKMLHLKEK